MRRFMMVHFLIAVMALSPLTAPLAAQASSAAPLNACSTLNPAFTTDDLAGIAAPCAAAPGTMLVEMLYYQNASRVGGTALAAYPLFRLRTGIARHLEAVVDTPSQIAMSGPHGIGLYPTTHIGYGLDYTFASNASMAAGFGIEMQPPSSRFTVDQSQPRYILALTAGYHLANRLTLSGIATGSSSQTVGFQRIMPAAAVRLAYDTGRATQVSGDFGERVVVRRAVAQSFSDIAVNQRLGKKVTFDVGLGTTFNPVSNAKAHYLASGFNFR